MHQGLWLSRSSIENTTGTPEDFQNMSIVLSFSAPPTNKADVDSKTFERYVLLHTDR